MAAPAELNKVLGALLKAPSKKIWDELEEFLPDGQSEVTPNEKGMRSIKKLIEMVLRSSPNFKGMSALLSIFHRGLEEMTETSKKKFLSRDSLRLLAAAFPKLAAARPSSAEHQHWDSCLDTICACLDIFTDPTALKGSKDERLAIEAFNRFFKLFLAQVLNNSQDRQTRQDMAGELLFILKGAKRRLKTARNKVDTSEIAAKSRLLGELFKSCSDCICQSRVLQVVFYSNCLETDPKKREDMIKDFCKSLALTPTSRTISKYAMCFSSKASKAGRSVNPRLASRQFRNFFNAANTDSTAIKVFKVPRITMNSTDRLSILNAWIDFGLESFTITWDENSTKSRSSGEEYKSSHLKILKGNILLDIPYNDVKPVGDITELEEAVVRLTIPHTPENKEGVNAAVLPPNITELEIELREKQLEDFKSVILAKYKRKFSIVDSIPKPVAVENSSGRRKLTRLPLSQITVNSFGRDIQGSSSKTSQHHRPGTQESSSSSDCKITTKRPSISLKKCIKSKKTPKRKGKLGGKFMLGKKGKKQDSTKREVKLEPELAKKDILESNKEVQKTGNFEKKSPRRRSARFIVKPKPCYAEKSSGESNASDGDEAQSEFFPSQEDDQQLSILKEPKDKQLIRQSYESDFEPSRKTSKHNQLLKENQMDFDLQDGLIEAPEPDGLQGPNSEDVLDGSSSSPNSHSESSQKISKKAHLDAKKARTTAAVRRNADKKATTKKSTIKMTKDTTAKKATAKQSKISSTSKNTSAKKVSKESAKVSSSSRKINAVSSKSQFSDISSSDSEIDLKNLQRRLGWSKNLSLESERPMTSSSSRKRRKNHEKRQNASDSQEDVVGSKFATPISRDGEGGKPPKRPRREKSQSPKASATKLSRQPSQDSSSLDHENNDILLTLRRLEQLAKKNKLGEASKILGLHQRLQSPVTQFSLLSSKKHPVSKENSRISGDDLHDDLATIARKINRKFHEGQQKVREAALESMREIQKKMTVILRNEGKSLDSTEMDKICGEVDEWCDNFSLSQVKQEFENKFSVLEQEIKNRMKEVEEATPTVDVQTLYDRSRKAWARALLPIKSIQKVLSNQTAGKDKKAKSSKADAIRSMLRKLGEES